MKRSPGRRVSADRVDSDEILPEYDFKRGSSTSLHPGTLLEAPLWSWIPMLLLFSPVQRKRMRPCARWRESYRNIGGGRSPGAASKARV